MLLQDSRRAARIDAAGELVTLEDQDRSRVGRADPEGGAAEAALRRTRPARTCSGGDRRLPCDRARGGPTDWERSLRCTRRSRSSARR